MRGLWWLENVGKAAVFVNGNAVQRFASSELTGCGAPPSPLPLLSAKGIAPCSCTIPAQFECQPSAGRTYILCDPVFLLPCGAASPERASACNCGESPATDPFYYHLVVHTNCPSSAECLLLPFLLPLSSFLSSKVLLVIGGIRLTFDKV
jgi:hypothetical protein